jgi:UPF0271 protein
VKTIDINCDLGEGGGMDAALMPLISSCNIACGGHYGNAESVDRTVELAKKNKVKVGAHPSYPDLANFGRKSLHMPAKALKESLHEQIDLVEQACQAQDVALHHIKPHGALYNDMRKSQNIADLVLEVLIERKTNLVVFVPPKVEFSQELPDSIRLWTEGFADRAYRKDLSLVPRTEKGAVLSDPATISERVANMATDGSVLTKLGKIIHQKFETICVHSDTPDALLILKAIHSKLTENAIQIGTPHEA